jgi:hypothetical protein
LNGPFFWRSSKMRADIDGPMPRTASNSARLAWLTFTAASAAVTPSKAAKASALIHENRCLIAIMIWVLQVIKESRA